MPTSNFVPDTTTDNLPAPTMALPADTVNTSLAQSPDSASAGDLKGSVRELARLVPACARLIRGAVRDGRVPLRRKIALGALVCYLALPFDLIPDFIPIVGYADDLILTWFVLRNFIRSVPPEVIEEHWTGEAPLAQWIDAVSNVVKKLRGKC